MFYFLPTINSKKTHFLQIDSDKTIMVTFKHDNKFQEGAECAFQVLTEILFQDYFTTFLKYLQYIFSLALS